MWYGQRYRRKIGWFLVLFLICTGAGAGCDLVEYRETKKRKEAYYEYLTLLKLNLKLLRESHDLKPAAKDEQEAAASKSRLDAMGQANEKIKNKIKRLNSWKALNEEDKEIRQLIGVSFARYTTAFGYRFLGPSVLEQISPEQKDLVYGGEGVVSFDELLSLIDASARQLERRLEEW